MLHGVTLRGLRAAVAAKAQPSDYVIAAGGIAAFARQIPALFPAAAGPGKRGLPPIFSERAEFEQKAAAMVTAAEALQKAAMANDLEGFAAGVKSVSEACGGCHQRLGKFARSWIDP